MVLQEWNRSVLGPKEGSFSELCFGVALAVEVKRIPKLVGDLPRHQLQENPPIGKLGHLETQNLDTPFFYTQATP